MRRSRIFGPREWSANVGFDTQEVALGGYMAPEVFVNPITSLLLEEPVLKSRR